MGSGGQEWKVGLGGVENPPSLHIIHPCHGSTPYIHNHMSTMLPLFLTIFHPRPLQLPPNPPPYLRTALPHSTPFPPLDTYLKGIFHIFNPSLQYVDFPFLECEKLELDLRLIGRRSRNESTERIIFMSPLCHSTSAAHRLLNLEDSSPSSNH